MDVSGRRRLGIDEISLRKGYQAFVIVLSDLDTPSLIGLAAARPPPCRHQDGAL